MGRKALFRRRKREKRKREETGKFRNQKKTIIQLFFRYAKGGEDGGERKDFMGCPGPTQLGGGGMTETKRERGKTK